MSTDELPEDDFIDVGDMPEMPDEIADEGVQDAFTYDVACKIAFVGVGHGGSRIAESFYKLGYRSVCVINTAISDLSKINIPEANKYAFGTGGAGKDPSIAKAGIEGHEEDLYDLYKRCLGDELDYVLVCLGAGGGTGAGAWRKCYDVLKTYLQENKRPQRVGVIAALPKDVEGQRPARNAVDTISELGDVSPSPFIIVDNERIQQIFRRTPPAQFWARCNNQITTLFHLFNRIAAQDAEHTNFDRVDLVKLLDSGIVVFGATTIKEYSSEADISKAIRQQLTANTLASTDLHTGKVAGCVFVLGKHAYQTMDSAYLDHGISTLGRILGEGSTIFQGIYPGNNEDIRCYTMIGQLELPKDRLKELARLAGL